MQTKDEEVTWTSFRTRFLEKYFPDSARHEREAEPDYSGIHIQIGVPSEILFAHHHQGVEMQKI